MLYNIKCTQNYHCMSASSKHKYQHVHIRWLKFLRFNLVHSALEM